MRDRRRPWEPLYDAVAIGMSVYAETAFRVRTVGRRPIELREGDLLVATHRAETDVPLICDRLFWGTGMLWHRARPRLHFAARDDMFERGFFAGFPPGLSLRARKLLYPIQAGPWLPRVRVNPLPYPSATVLRVGRALASVPAGSPLPDVLPPELVGRLQARAREAGLTPPRTAADVLHGVYADLLWESYERDVLASPLLEDAWRQRSREAAQDVRHVIDLLRSGAPLLFFPEGRPSPDGAVGPLRPGMRLLIERGEPRAVVPVGIAYDALTVGRPWAFLSVGAPVEPPREDVDRGILALMCRSLPFTCGQAAATALRRSAGRGSGALPLAELAAAVEAGLEAARRDGRPYDAALLDAAERGRRLRQLVRWLERNGLGRVEGQRALAFEAEAVLADERLARAAREHASATASA